MLQRAVQSAADLPAGRNHHWTKSLVASADGSRLYVGVGSNSNIAEHGMDEEQERAAVLEIDPATGARRLFASGLRNPVGMAWQPDSGKLWVAVNDATKKASVDKDLKAGQDFRTVALRYTDQPQAAQSGAVFPSENVEMLPPEFQAAIKKTPENKATDWISFQGSSIKLFVQKKTPAKKWEITDAVKKLGVVQGTVGTGQNQLAYAIQLANSQISNFSAAESRIRDADVAAEAANLTKAQVLQQASIAAMGQANSAPQAVLSLLRS